MINMNYKNLKGALKDAAWIGGTTLVVGGCNPLEKLGLTGSKEKEAINPYSQFKVLYFSTEIDRNPECFNPETGWVKLVIDFDKDGKYDDIAVVGPYENKPSQALEKITNNLQKSNVIKLIQKKYAKMRMVDDPRPTFENGVTWDNVTEDTLDYYLIKVHPGNLKFADIEPYIVKDNPVEFGEIGYDGIKNPVTRKRLFEEHQQKQQKRKADSASKKLLSKRHNSGFYYTPSR